MRRRDPKTLWSLAVLAVLGILWMIPSFRFHVSHLLPLSSIHQWTREVLSLGVWGPLASIALMAMGTTVVCHRLWSFYSCSTKAFKSVSDSTIDFV